MKQEELQQLLTSFEQEVGHIKEWQIDRLENNREKLRNARELTNFQTHVSKLNKSKRKLTDSDIIQMKELYRNDISHSFGTLAKLYNVDKVTVHYIMNNKIYTDIGGKVNIRESKPTCPHCGIKTTQGNYTRWHGDNCKHIKPKK